jgi:hypothetical protein
VTTSFGDQQLTQSGIALKEAQVVAGTDQFE